MRTLSTASALALIAALGTFPVAFADEGDQAGKVEARADTGSADAAATAEIFANEPVTVDASLVGMTVIDADSGEEIGTILSVSTEEGAEHSVSVLSGSGESKTIVEADLSKDAEGRIVAKISAERDDATGAIDTESEADVEVDVEADDNEAEIEADVEVENPE